MSKSIKNIIVQVCQEEMIKLAAKYLLFVNIKQKDREPSRKEGKLNLCRSI